MKVVFRTDASLEIGTGHVMRCLTLADALTARGADCQFISRDHPGHLFEAIHRRGYWVNRLSTSKHSAPTNLKDYWREAMGTNGHPTHASWLGATQMADAEESIAIVANINPHWLVVDHYALDERWEFSLSPYCRKLMVIDDLADRTHNCDLLLDQNLGHRPEHYASLVPEHCQVLTGPKHALLRPEFAEIRPYSLQRRESLCYPQRLLISMGGVDQSNATGRVLQSLKHCDLPANCSITVVMGLTAPWLRNVQDMAAQMPWPTEVVVNVDDMAQRMLYSDLAIGAAGSTSWERCCLGLPTLLIVLADNQRHIASSLRTAGAALVLDSTDETQFPIQMSRAFEMLLGDKFMLSNMTRRAAEISPGRGLEIVLEHLLDLNTHENHDPLQ